MLDRKIMNEDEFKKILNQMLNADKTPEYEYFSGEGDNANYHNAMGKAPGTGGRWTTPRDMCKIWLRDIESGNLSKALKELMGEDGIKDEIKTGSVCTQCKSGRVALMTAMVGSAEMDDEPYKEGDKEGDNESVELLDYITLSIHACDNCGHVYSVNIE